MIDLAPPHLAAMLRAAEREWQTFSPDDWTTIDFRRWSRGFHRSAWVAAGYIGCNPLDVLDRPTPAARAVNALLTRQCLILTIAMTQRVPDPGNAAEPLLAWFNEARQEHQHGIASTVEAMGDTEWQLPRSRRQAARKLVSMWEQGGAAAFGDMAALLTVAPDASHGQNAHARGHRLIGHGQEGDGASGRKSGSAFATAKQARIAADIADHMHGFKHLLDTAQPGTMDELCRRHPGFHRYAKTLEGIARAIGSGAITVPR